MSAPAFRTLLAGLAICACVAGNVVFAQAQPPAPAAPPAGAAGPQARPLALDPALEERVLKIAAELRCLVCQNETIAASHADLAVDLRNQVREQLRAGKSDAEIRAYMVARYGDFVLYTPPVKPTTWLLWVGPFLLLAAMAFVLWRTLSRRRALAAPQPLSEAEQRRARELLNAAAAGGGVPKK
ncbi:MAG: cytochrome c-type biogenesis protein CcmH [Rubrivivax sp.]|nr:cytochrome c-type biogenesis protein CcmH [Rubrivivax sp.]